MRKHFLAAMLFFAAWAFIAPVSWVGFVAAQTPTISSLNPSSGAATGGYTVTITGTNFNTVNSGATGSNEVRIHNLANAGFPNNMDVYNCPTGTSSTLTFTMPNIVANSGATGSGTSGITGIILQVTPSGSGTTGTTSGSFSFYFTPTAPTGLAGTTTASGAATITWTAATVASGYTIQSATSSNGTYATAGTTTATTFTASGLTNGATYYFKVAATNQSMTSAYTATVGPFVPLGTPTVASASPSSGAVTGGYTVTITGAGFNTLNAGATGSNEVRIHNLANAGFPNNMDVYNCATGTTTTLAFTMPNILANSGATGSGTSGITGIILQVTPSGSGTTGSTSGNLSFYFTPTTPTGLAVTTTASGVATITWTASTVASGYTIQSATTSNGTYTTAGTTTATTFTASGLTNGATYYFQVAATNQSLTSAYTATIGPFVSLGTPTIASTSPSSGDVAGGYTVTITGSGFNTLNSGATGSNEVRVHNLANNGFANNMDQYNVPTSSTTSITFTMPNILANSGATGSGTAGITGVILQVTPSGSGTTGATSVGQTFYFNPTTPTGLGGSSFSNGSVPLTWTAATVASGYTIQSATSSSGPFTAAGTTTATTFTVTGLSNGMTYYFQVAATNSNMTSAYTSPVGPFTPLATPVVTSLSPGYGNINGGYTVTINGSGFNTINTGATGSNTIRIHNLAGSGVAGYPDLFNVPAVNANTITFTMPSWAASGYTGQQIQVNDQGSNNGVTGGNQQFALVTDITSSLSSLGTYGPTAGVANLNGLAYSGAAAFSNVSSPSGGWSGHPQVWYSATFSQGWVYTFTEAASTQTSFISLQDAATQYRFGDTGTISNWTCPATATYYIICSQSVTATTGGGAFTLQIQTTPSVSSISPGYGSITGGYTVTLTGTGFNTNNSGATGSNTVRIHTINNNGITDLENIAAATSTSLTFTMPDLSASGYTALLVQVNNLGGNTGQTSSAPNSQPFALVTNIALNPSSGIYPATAGVSPLSTFAYTGAAALTNGGGIPGSGWSGFPQVWYSVALIQGEIYTFTEAASTQTSVISLQDGVTQWQFNGAGTISNWTCPATATYYVICSQSTTATTSGGAFTLQIQLVGGPPPTMTALSGTTSAPVTGGTSTTQINGTNFYGVTSIQFGSATLTTGQYTVTSTAITLTAPTITTGAGVVNITVNTVAGSVSSTVPAQQFTYLPTLASINPTTGTIGGGTPVTITGAGFTGASAVAFGSATVTAGFTVNNDNSITVASPSLPAGPVNVTVTVGGLTTSISSADEFTYYFNYNYSWWTWAGGLNWSTPSGAAITWNSQTLNVGSISVNNGFYSWYTPATQYGITAATGQPYGIQFGSPWATNLAAAGGMNGPFANNDPTGNNGSIAGGDWKDFVTGKVSYYNNGAYSNAAAWNNPVFWSYYNAAFGASTTYTVNATKTTYTTNTGLQYFFTTDGLPNSPLGTTNYVGNSGMYYFNTDSTNTGNAKYSNGPLYQDSRTRITDVTDGSSNTLMFGESLGGADNAPPTYTLSWMGTGTMPSYWDCQSPSQYFMFASRHPNAVNFAFCDGSVRSVSRVPASVPTDTFDAPPAASQPPPGSPRWQAFQLLAGISDNATADLTQLGLSQP